MSLRLIAPADFEVHTPGSVVRGLAGSTPVIRIGCHCGVQLVWWPDMNSDQVLLLWRQYHGVDR